METVATRVRQLESDYQSGTVTISEHVDFDLKSTISRIEAYLNSRHISGSTDSQGREKPFFNIVTAAANIWYRATDIDRKDIRIKTDKQSNWVATMLANIKLQEWMRDESFGQFLNEWGRTLARYGSAVVKFVEAEGKLHKMVVPWNTLIVDPIDFENNIVVEVLDLTPAQLRQRKNYDQTMVKALIESSKQTRETLDGQNKDNKSGYIRIYEAHGLIEKSCLTEDEKDDDVFVQQMHVISYTANKEGGYDEFTLYKGKEDKNPYMITHLIKEDGRSLAIGAVENLFQSQWMLNHSAKLVKDQLDMASKLIYQTSDSRFVGTNALNAIENGDILIHEVNQPLTQVNNVSHDIASIQSMGNSWKQLGNEINGISEAMLGETPKSGTAWRQTEAVLNESRSLFELMTENKSLALEDMFKIYIIPYLKKTLGNKKEIVATLNDYGVKKLEKIYVKNSAIKRVNDKIIEDVLNDQKPTPEMQAQMMSQEALNVQDSLNSMGDERFFAPDELSEKEWKDIIGNIGLDVYVDVTGESNSSAMAMTTLNTMFQTLVAMQGRPMSPQEKLVFSKILNEVGTVSPVELNETETAPQPVQVQPNQLEITNKQE
jgi:hypothetical protein